MTRKNLYDEFAALRQKELITGEKKPHRYVEKPMMKKLLPPLKNQRVLLIGCGTGEESLMIKKAGANKIIGIDTSKESIRIAKKSYPESEFLVGDMKNLKFKKNSFDFVYSSLAVHYSKKPEKVYHEVFRVLKPGCLFLFSTVHPVRWASEKVGINGNPARIIGGSNEDGKTYGKYLSFTRQDHHFPSGETLSFWVGCPSLHFKLLRKVGFNVEEFVESKAIPECKAKDLAYYKKNSEFPQFMAFLARKPK